MSSCLPVKKIMFFMSSCQKDHVFASGHKKRSPKSFDSEDLK